jgi:hypothetical protein
MRFATPSALAATAILIALASFVGDFPFWP